MKQIPNRLWGIMLSPEWENIKCSYKEHCVFIISDAVKRMQSPAVLNPKLIHLAFRHPDINAFSQQVFYRLAVISVTVCHKASGNSGKIKVAAYLYPLD